MLKIRALFCQHFLLLYVRVDFLLSRGKHWHCDVCMCEVSLQKFKKKVLFSTCSPISCTNRADCHR